MIEFNSRIDAQRHLLEAVNDRPWDEPLFGLSKGAIERWAAANRLESDSALLAKVREAAGQLYFLANHSEDQISEEYRSSSQRIAEIARAISSEQGSESN